MIKKVHINTCPILDGYGVTGVFKFPYTPSCEPRLTAGVSLLTMDAADVIRNSELKLLTCYSRVSQPSGSLCLRPAVAFSKTSFKHR